MAEPRVEAYRADGGARGQRGRQTAGDPLDAGAGCGVAGVRQVEEEHARGEHEGGRFGNGAVYAAGSVGEEPQADAPLVQTAAALGERAGAVPARAGRPGPISLRIVPPSMTRAEATRRRRARLGWVRLKTG